MLAILKGNTLKERSSFGKSWHVHVTARAVLPLAYITLLDADLWHASIKGYDSRFSYATCPQVISK